ncbi:unnamed protein product [Aureobasidium pullulans]|nr:unnamed protein product [Aureobasidium pullulans]
MPILEARQYYGYYNRCYGNNCNSTWNRWGRWVLLACIIAVFFILFFLFSCLSAKRRRRRGANPYYGTGWTRLLTCITAYSPPPNTTNYHGGNNIELQQPQAAYNGNYAPPKDPPPARY